LSEIYNSCKFHVSLGSEFILQLIPGVRIDIYNGFYLNTFDFLQFTGTFGLFYIDWIGLIVFNGHFQQYFSYIIATSFSGGGSRSTRREPPTMGKQLVN